MMKFPMCVEIMKSKNMFQASNLDTWIDIVIFCTIKDAYNKSSKNLSSIVLNQPQWGFSDFLCFPLLSPVIFPWFLYKKPFSSVLVPVGSACTQPSVNICCTSSRRRGAKSPRLLISSCGNSVGKTTGNRNKHVPGWGSNECVYVFQEFLVL